MRRSVDMRSPGTAIITVTLRLAVSRRTVTVTRCASCARAAATSSARSASTGAWNSSSRGNDSNAATVAL